MPATSTVVDLGRYFFASLLLAPNTYIGWGTGPLSVVGTETTLSNEIGVRQSATVTQPGGLSTVNYSATLTNPGPSSVIITNAGVFNAISGGTLLMIASLGSPYTLAAGESIAFTFALGLEQA